MVHRRWRQGQRRRRANTSQIGKTVTYTYDAAGKVTGIKYPSGRQLSVTYTGGQPSAMALAKNATAAPVDLISDIRWEPFGGVKSWQWQLASGTQLHERVHDTSGRPVRYRLGANLRDLTYDAADRIVAYTHYAAAGGAPQPALDQGFAYDELGRLRTVTTASANWSINHDANGNRTSLTLNGTSPNVYTVSSTSNRLNSVTNPLRSFGYDAAGNTVSDSASHTASFNLAGRLASLTKGGVSTTYSVDGLGRRVRKFDTIGAASTTVFVYDAGGQLLGEYSSTGTPLREYVWLGGTPVAVFTPDPTGATKPPLVYFIHTDHLDTPRLVLDKSNNLRWSWIAEPFGTTAANPNPQGLGVFVFNLRFPGQYFDQESGLHYNYFRDYDATLGRYVQSDPIGLAGGINTYVYAESQPTSLIDPLGLSTYLCTQPLHALGKVGEWVYSPKSNKLHHKFIGVIRPDGTTHVGGQDRAGGPWGDGTPSRGDAERGNHQCEKVEDDNECLEQCLLPKMYSSQRPKYALIPATFNGGENCQSWADKTVEECRNQCKLRR